MQKEFQRYAIYWTPGKGSGLAAFGESWFQGGSSFGLPPYLFAKAIKAPGVYRLHATLKAPFRLADGFSAGMLQIALDDFCSKRRACEGGPLTLGHYQRYLTLLLSGDEAGISWLAEECVTHFDRFRAPFDAKRDKPRDLDPLTAQEKIFLKEFGYPYVMSAFRFHISLAGALERADLEAVRCAIEPELGAFMTGRFVINEISLQGEPAGGSVFELISRHACCKRPEAVAATPIPGSFPLCRPRFQRQLSALAP